MELRGCRRMQKPKSRLCRLFSKLYYSKSLSQAQQENTGQPFLR